MEEVGGTGPGSPWPPVQPFQGGKMGKSRLKSAAQGLGGNIAGYFMGFALDMAIKAIFGDPVEEALDQINAKLDKMQQDIDYMKGQLDVVLNAVHLEAAYTRASLYATVQFSNASHVFEYIDNHFEALQWMTENPTMYRASQLQAMARDILNGADSIAFKMNALHRHIMGGYPGLSSTGLIGGTAEWLRAGMEARFGPNYGSMEPAELLNAYLTLENMFLQLQDIQAKGLIVAGNAAKVYTESGATPGQVSPAWCPSDVEGFINDIVTPHLQEQSEEFAQQAARLLMTVAFADARNGNFLREGFYPVLQEAFARIDYLRAEWKPGVLENGVTNLTVARLVGQPGPEMGYDRPLANPTAATSGGSAMTDLMGGLYVEAPGYIAVNGEQVQGQWRTRVAEKFGFTSQAFYTHDGSARYAYSPTLQPPKAIPCAEIEVEDAGITYRHATIIVRREPLDIPWYWTKWYCEGYQAPYFNYTKWEQQQKSMLGEGPMLDPLSLTSADWLRYSRVEYGPIDSIWDERWQTTGAQVFGFIDPLADAVTFRAHYKTRHQWQVYRVRHKNKLAKCDLRGHWILITPGGTLSNSVTQYSTGNVLEVKYPPPFDKNFDVEVTIWTAGQGGWRMGFWQELWFTVGGAWLKSLLEVTNLRYTPAAVVNPPPPDGGGGGGGRGY